MPPTMLEFHNDCAQPAVGSHGLYPFDYATAARSSTAPTFDRQSNRRVRQNAPPPLRRNDGSGVVMTRYPCSVSWRRRRLSQSDVTIVSPTQTALVAMRHAAAMGTSIRCAGATL